MNTLSKGLVGTVAIGAMALASASPAVARDRYHHDDGISAGDVIAGALVIGGIAAIASAASHDNDRYDRGYNGDRGYGDYGNPRRAVEMCVNTAARQANRYSYGGRARVTDIRDIDRNRDGYTVRGRIAVNTQGRYWRNGDRNYGRGWGGDYRGWNNNLRGYDAGSFTCKVRYGRVSDIDFNGIRGL
jgi:hypothetical protein